jgi:hypothetical protein
MTTKVDNSTGVVGRESSADMVLVLRIPTKEMVESAWAEAFAEDAVGVWQVMIETYERTGNSSTGNG